MTTTTLIPPQSDLVRLAARKISTKLLALLAPHKIALLAIERQAEEIVKEEVLGATSVLEMFRTSKRHLKAVQKVAAKLAYEHAAKEFALMGLPVPAMPPINNAYLDSINADLRQALKQAGLSRTTKARRAGLAAVSVANRAYTDMQLALYAQVGEDGVQTIEKIWVTNKTAATPPCAYCTALDGKVVSIEAEFPIPKGLKVYRDLQGPPAHPNCRCRLVPRLGAKVNV